MRQGLDRFEDGGESSEVHMEIVRHLGLPYLSTCLSRVEIGPSYPSNLSIYDIVSLEVSFRDIQNIRDSKQTRHQTPEQTHARTNMCIHQCTFCIGCGNNMTGYTLFSSCGLYSARHGCGNQFVIAQARRMPSNTLCNTCATPPPPPPPKPLICFDVMGRPFYPEYVGEGPEGFLNNGNQQ